MQRNVGQQTTPVRLEANLVYARFSHDHQNPTSIDDQAVLCRDTAQRLHDCQVCCLVSDHAESVKDHTAPNWDYVLDGVRAGVVKRVYVDELSRFARCLEDVLRVQRLFRFYDASLFAVHENIDITDEHADIHVIFAGYKNQAATRDARHRIKRSMDGNLRRKLSNGDIRFGYSSERLTEEEIRQLGLPPRPEDKAPYRKLVINRQEADVERQVHYWFAVLKMSIRGIARKLNEMKVPRGGKARTDRWKPINVRKILASRRYLGFRWRNEIMMVRNPDTGRLAIKKQDPAERIEVYDPDLAIIDQATYDATMRRFDEIHKVHPAGERGWKRSAGSPQEYAPKQLFALNLVCGVCGAKLTQMSGHMGGYYGCPDAPLGLCTNKVKANRVLTEQLLLETIRSELDQDLIVDVVLQLLHDEVEQMVSATPDEVARLKTRLARAERETQRLVEAIATAGDIGALTSALRQRATEKVDVERQLREAERRASVPAAKPDRTWVEQQLRENLAEVLGAEVTRAALLLRRITGPIEVHPAKKPWLRQPHLVARLRIDVAAACGAVGSATGSVPNVESLSGFGTVVEVELRKTPFYERHGSQVVYSHDVEKKQFTQIARELPGNVSAAAVKFAYNFGKFGTPDPGNRAWQTHCKRVATRRAARARRNADSA